jgi:hypothetical protein
MNIGIVKERKERKGNEMKTAQNEGLEKRGKGKG